MAVFGGDTTWGSAKRASKPVWPEPAPSSKAGGSQWLTCRTSRAVLWRRPVDPRCPCTAGLLLLLALSMLGRTRPFSTYPTTGVVLVSIYAFLGRWHHSETDCNVWTLAAAGNCKCKPFLSAANASRKGHHLGTPLWCCRKRAGKPLQCCSCQWS